MPFGPVVNRKPGELFGDRVSRLERLLPPRRPQDLLGLDRDVAPVADEVAEFEGELVGVDGVVVAENGRVVGVPLGGLLVRRCDTNATMAS